MGPAVIVQPPGNGLGAPFLRRTDTGQEPQNPLHLVRVHEGLPVDRPATARNGSRARHQRVRSGRGGASHQDNGQDGEKESCAHARIIVEP